MIKKFDALLIALWNYHPLVLPLCMVIIIFASIALARSFANGWAALCEIGRVILIGVVMVRVVVLIYRDMME